MMNRAKRRKLQKLLRCFNAKEEHLLEGDKVKINTEKILSEPNWKNKNKTYQSFVLEHKDTIFTVEYDPINTQRRQVYQKGAYPALLCLKEDPNHFLFWEGDLIKVKVCS